MVLIVACDVIINPVRADADLFHNEQIDETGEGSASVRLTLNLACYAIVLRNGRCEAAVRKERDENEIGLRNTFDHVLDEIAMTPVGARDSCNTTLTLQLSTAHIGSEGE